jgi:hypothetical protein
VSADSAEVAAVGGELNDVAAAEGDDDETSAAAAAPVTGDGDDEEDVGVCCKAKLS